MNAAAWTSVVRAGGIPSRRAGTDAAIVNACRAVLAGVPRTPEPHVLDVGCGEGWLARALAGEGARVLGIDGSERLVEAARAADQGAGAAYEVVSYDALIADGFAAAGPFVLIVCNFALLGEPIAPLLAALRRRLAPGGRLVVQTVHPWAAVGDDPYADGWREERFSAFAEPFPSAMPWYFRTMASWLAAVRVAGLEVVALAEPLHGETGRPLSLLLDCTAAA